MESPYDKYQGFTPGLIVKVSKKWPFGIEVVDESGNALLSLSMYAFSSGDTYETVIKRPENQPLLSLLNFLAAAPLLLQDCREMWEVLVSAHDSLWSNSWTRRQKAMERIKELLNRITERHKEV